MAQRDTTTKFSFSYGELLQQALEKSAFFRRDQTALASRGVTDNMLDSFDDLITAFRETQDDEIFKGLINIAVQKRDEKRKEMEIMGRDILGMAELAFRNDPGKLQIIGFNSTGRLNDGDFLKDADRLYMKTQEYLSEISAKGLTQQMLTDFKALIDAFDPMVKYLGTAKSDRDINTRNRHAAANALYDAMAEICMAGVKYFQDRDPARYSDYLIYDKVPTTQTRSGVVKPKTTVSRSFTGIHPETFFRIKSEGPGALDFYYSTSDGGNPVTPSITVPAFQEHSYNATELGYSVETGAIKFNIRNLSETETSNYLIRIE